MMHNTIDLIYQEDNALLDYMRVARRADYSDPAQVERVREAALHSRSLTRLLETQGKHIAPLLFMRDV